MLGKHKSKNDVLRKFLSKKVEFWFVLKRVKGLHYKKNQEERHYRSS